MSSNRFKIYESLWVDRSDFVNGLNFILLMYGAILVTVEVVFPDTRSWLKFLRFYLITMAAMWFVQRSVNKLSKAPQRVDSSTPNSPSS